MLGSRRGFCDHGQYQCSDQQLWSGCHCQLSLLRVGAFRARAQREICTVPLPHHVSNNSETPWSLAILLALQSCRHLSQGSTWGVPTIIRNAFKKSIALKTPCKIWNLESDVQVRQCSPVPVQWQDAWQYTQFLYKTDCHRLGCPVVHCVWPTNALVSLLKVMHPSSLQGNTAFAVPILGPEIHKAPTHDHVLTTLLLHEVYAAVSVR